MGEHLNRLSPGKIIDGFLNLHIRPVIHNHKFYSYIKQSLKQQQCYNTPATDPASRFGNGTTVPHTQQSALSDNGADADVAMSDVLSTNVLVLRWHDGDNFGRLQAPLLTPSFSTVSMFCDINCLSLVSSRNAACNNICNNTHYRVVASFEITVSELIPMRDGCLVLPNYTRVSRCEIVRMLDFVSAYARF